MKNKAICAFPWKALYTNSFEQIYPCCLNEDIFNLHAKTDDGLSILASENQSISKAVNSNFFKDLRLKMLKGEESSSCSSCYENEKSGRSSYRLASFDILEVSEDELSQLTNTDGQIEPDIQFIDSKPGNQCNLNCLMCSPSLSTGVLKDHQKRGITDITPPKYLLGSDEYWQWMTKNVSGLRRVNLAGGEPFLNKRVKDFIRESLDYKDRLQVCLNTNLSVIDKNFIDDLKKYHHVSIMISLDGVEEINDFIRFPLQFKKFKQNLNLLLEEFKDHPRFEVLVNTVCSVYNVENIIDILTWVQDHIHPLTYHNFSFLNKPEVLNICNLPGPYKDILITKFKKVVKLNILSKWNGIFLETISHLEKSAKDLDWSKNFGAFHSDYEKLRAFQIDLPFIGYLK